MRFLGVLLPFSTTGHLGIHDAYFPKFASSMSLQSFRLFTLRKKNFDLPDTNMSWALNTSQTLFVAFRGDESGIDDDASVPRSDVPIFEATESTIFLNGVGKISFPSGLEAVGLV